MKELQWRFWSSPSPSQGLFPLHSLRMEIVSCLLWVILKNQNHFSKIHNVSITAWKGWLKSLCPHLLCPTCSGTLGVLALTAAGRGYSSKPASDLSNSWLIPSWKKALVWVSQYLEPWKPFPAKMVGERSHSIPWAGSSSTSQSQKNVSNNIYIKCNQGLLQE